MRFRLLAATLGAAVLLAGCAGARIGLSSEAAPAMRGSAPPPGTSYSSATVRAEAGGNAYFGLLFLGAFAAGVEDPSMSSRYGRGWRKPPPLAGDRAIDERDCTEPLQAPSANLRCK